MALFDDFINSITGGASAGAAGKKAAPAEKSSDKAVTAGAARFNPANAQNVPPRGYEGLAKQGPINFSNEQLGTTNRTGTLDRAQAVFAQQQGVEEDKTRNTRANVLGITGEPGLPEGPEKPAETEAMTREAYDKLSNRQRAAVDFNGLLAKALDTDKKNQAQYKGLSDEARDAYDVSVKDMFGEDRGSDLYAPETMAVLRQLQINDKAEDLDDYLNLRVAITEDDLSSLENTAISGRSSIMNPETEGRTEIVNRMADRTLDLQAKLAKGNDLLRGFNAAALTERRDDLANLGIQVQDDQPGYGNSLRDQAFQQAFEGLSLARNDETAAAGILDELRRTAGDQWATDAPLFQQFVDDRTRNAARYDIPLGQAEGETYRKPDEFRSLFGLEN